jgi:radical SAM protein with 4Fe4S-binding SPASM domain
MVDFFKQHDFCITLSNDGVHTGKVRPNILEDRERLALLKKVNTLSFSAVLHAYNLDFERTFRYWRGKLGLGHNPPAMFELLLIPWEMDSDIYDFDLRAFRQSMKWLCAKAKEELAALNSGKQLYPAAWTLIEKICTKIMSGGMYAKDFPMTKCGQVTHTLNVDLAGNVFACHGISLPVGTIRDNPQQWEQALWRHAKEAGLESCQSCAYYPYCLGGCPLSIKSGKHQEKYCDVMKIWIDECREFVASFGGEKE